MGWYISNYPRTPFLDVLFFYPTFPKWKGTSKDTIQPKVFVTSWTETWTRLFCIFGVHRDADVQLQSLPLSKLHLRALFLMFILEGNDYGK